MVRERLAGLTESVHSLELQIHEKRLHVTSVLERVQSELGLDENILVSEYGPDQDVPGEDDADPTPFDRGRQTRRLQPVPGQPPKCSFNGEAAQNDGVPARFCHDPPLMMC